MPTQHRHLLIAALLAGLALAQPALAQFVGESVVIADEQTQDVYAAGGKVLLQAPVQGDAVLAGGMVLVTGPVSADLTAAGGSITVTGDVGDDARLAGGQVTLSASVAGHAAISGGSVSVERDATINGWAWLAGGNVEMNGWVTGDVRIVGGHIELAGRVDGNVALIGDEIEIDDGAVITGNLTWRSRHEPDIHKKATITGEISAGEAWPEHRGGGGGGWLGGLMAWFSVVFAAGVFYTLFRRPLGRCFALFRGGPGRALLAGLGVLLVTPVAIAVLLATGIGLLLGLLLLTAYGLALASGGLAGIGLAARWALDRWRHRPDPGLGEAWVAIAGVTLVMLLLYVIPPLGALVATLVLLAGLGAGATAIYRAIVPAPAG